MSESLILQFVPEVPPTSTCMSSKLIAPEFCSTIFTHLSFGFLATMDVDILHLYLSLYQGDENAFSSKNRKDNLSKTGQNFMAGILEYSSEMSILTNQWINSYKRLLPDLEAPVAGKGLNNSTSDIVRIPHIYKDDKDNARIEFRLPDSSCNPYLTLSAILHAGLLGIKNNLVIDKKWQSNIPSSLYEAIKVAENSNFLKDAIGNQAYNSILENKEKEWVEHHSVVTDYERNYYMKFL